MENQVSFQNVIVQLLTEHYTPKTRFVEVNQL